VELELLHVHRVTAFCHKRAGIVGEECVLARGGFPPLAHAPDLAPNPDPGSDIVSAKDHEQDHDQEHEKDDG
jgi:hypothetical protein